MAKYLLSDWSRDVKVRDGKCMECSRTEDLHAHHIKPKSTHPELKLDLDNGKTLCYRCHKAEHEKNRPVRIRSTNPQRRTLLKQNYYLLQRVEELKVEISKLKGCEVVKVDEGTNVIEKKYQRCKYNKFCKWQH